MTPSTTSAKTRLPGWADPDHPIFRLEIQRLARNRGLNFLHYSFNPLIFGGIALTILFIVIASVSTSAFTGIDSLFELILAWTIGVLIAAQIVTGAFANVLVIAQTSPTISGEMELQSWRLLRATTLNLREIVFAKLYAALLNLRLLLVGLLTLRIVTTVSAMLMVAYVFLRQTLYYMDAAQLNEFFVDFKWAPVLIPAGVCCVWFMAQPPIQFVLNGVIGMTASAYSRSRAQAVAFGLTGRLALWVFTVLINVAASYALGYLFASWSEPSSAPIEAFRGRPSPSEAQILWALGLTVSMYVIAVLSGQIGMILLGLGLILRQARKLGV